jgi:hypothetical protein
MVATKNFIDPAEDLDEEFDPYTAQDDLDDAQEQLKQDQYAARLEEDEHFEERTERIIETSKSTLAPRTLKAYNSFVPFFLQKKKLVINDLFRLHKQFVAFITTRYPQKGLENLNTALSKCPQYICEWIENTCQLKGSSRPKKFLDLSGTRERAATYSHALKMRAATSFWFAAICPHHCGNSEWVQVRGTTLWQGNPSLSPTVSKYMKALNKLKVNSRS